MFHPNNGNAAARRGGLLARVSAKLFAKEFAIILSTIFLAALVATPAHAICLRAGYIGNWQKDAKGVFKCVATEDRNTCSKGQTSCNPQVWGYSDADSRKLHCVSESSNLETSCKEAQKAAQQLRSNPSLFPDLAAMFGFKGKENPKSFREIYEGLFKTKKNIDGLAKDDASSPNRRMAEGKIRGIDSTELSAAKEASKQMTSEAQKRKKELQAIARRKKAEAAKRDRVIKELSAKAEADSNALQETIAARTEAKEQAKASTADTRSAPCAAQAPAPCSQTAQPPPPPPESKLLGPELSCVRDGLHEAFPGTQPSERFIALLATAAQHYHGPFNPNDTNQMKDLRKRVIQMVQSYGFCDEDSYPTEDLTNKKVAAQVRDWITGLNGAIKTNSGKYIEDATGDHNGKLGITRIADAFGIDDGGWHAFSNRPIFDELFKVSDERWNKMTLAERQSNWAFSNGSINDKPSWTKCRENLQKRMTNEPAFRLQLADGGVAFLDEREYKNKDGSWNVAFPPIEKLAKAKQTMIAIEIDNFKVCQKMANSCGLEENETCSPGDGIGSTEEQLNSGNGFRVTPRGVHYRSPGAVQ